jgi:hypothetical protein
VAAAVWSGAVGLRGIVGHQLDDAAADELAGVDTWVRSVGPARAHALARRTVVVEVAALGALGVCLAGFAPAAPFGGRPCSPGACEHVNNLGTLVRW